LDCADIKRLALVLVYLFLDQTGGVSDNKSGWDKNLIKHSEHYKWTEDDRSKSYADIVGYVSDLLNQAKVRSVDKLAGIPIEATFDGNLLKSWRILTEVI
jgi:hypothetical protein